MNMSEQRSVSSGGTDEGATSAAAAEDDPIDVVESAGHFRIYLGAAAGVGKTYAMLNEGHRRKQRGTDVVIGFVESHGRPLTQERCDELEIVPRRVIDYRGTHFEEMDLDAVLARQPKVALIDELAHTNVPGSRHAKRWEDVLEILDAGIDVITTVNIQHLESIADAVEQMTGAQVRERVPDWVVRKANQIELVDSSPESLRRRMLHGNIYPRAKVPQALTHFFRTDNLIALRELALRFLADETEDDLLEHLRRHRTGVLWETSERILVAVTAAPGTDGIVRRASRMATRIKAHLHVLHVVTGEGVPRTHDQQLAILRQLATDVGADWDELHADDPARAIIDYARDHQITQIVVGSSSRSRWQELKGGGSIVRKMSRLAAAAGIDMHIIARRSVPHEAVETAEEPGEG
jgi:two-component system sensor histidine kinase KdpD